MNNKKYRFLSLIIALVLTFQVSVFAEETPTPPVENPQETTTAKQEKPLNEDTFERYIVEGMVDAVDKSYRYGIDREEIYKSIISRLLALNPELMDDALYAIFDQLDIHSEYYTAEEYKELMEYVTNTFCGIGVIISEVDEGLFVMSVLPNSPALQEGVMVGDIIVSADGNPLAGLSTDEAKKFIVGEEGTNVTVGIMRNGEYIEKIMTRAQVENVSGYYDVISDKIGYISLDSFDGHCDKMISEALKSFDEKNITKIIIDLRYNPGGSLDEYVKVSQHFFPKGPVISMDYKDPEKKEIYYSENENPKYTLAVLINEHSASASEAFSGAVQDTKVGVVIGEKSFGKGTKQFISRIWTGGGVKLTDAEYLTAGGRRINNVGIYPDIEVTNELVKYSKEVFGVLSMEKKFNIGDKSEEVVKIKRRLHIMGYDVGYPGNDTYDEKTWAATCSFQRATGLYPYGVMDFSTQLMLESTLATSQVRPDKQLETAIKVLTDDSWKEYVGLGIVDVSDNEPKPTLKRPE